MSPGELARERGRRSRRESWREGEGGHEQGGEDRDVQEGKGPGRENGGEAKGLNVWKVLSPEACAPSPMATSSPPPPPIAGERPEGKDNSRMELSLCSPEPQEAELGAVPPSAIPQPPTRQLLGDGDEADAKILIRWSEPLDSSGRLDPHTVPASTPQHVRTAPKIFSVGLTPPSMHGSERKLPSEARLSTSKSVTKPGSGVEHSTLSRPSGGLAAGKVRPALIGGGRGQGGSGGAVEVSLGLPPSATCFAVALTPAAPLELPFPPVREHASPPVQTQQSIAVLSSDSADAVAQAARSEEYARGATCTPGVSSSDIPVANTMLTPRSSHSRLPPGATLVKVGAYVRGEGGGGGGGGEGGAEGEGWPPAALGLANRAQDHLRVACLQDRAELLPGKTDDP